MVYLVLFLFVLALYDQYLCVEIDRDGHLAHLLERKRLRRQRLFARLVGALGVVLFFALWRFQ